MECKNKHRLGVTKRIADGLSQKTEAQMMCENTSVEISTKRTNWANKTQILDVKIHLNEVSTKSRD